MRRWVVACCLCSAGVAAGATSVLAQYGLVQSELTLVVGRPPHTALPLWALSELRAVPPHKRVEAVKRLSAWAQAYATSADFKQRYAEARAEATPQAPKPPQSAAQLTRAMEEQQRAELLELRRNLQGLPREQRLDAETRFKELEAEHQRTLAGLAARNTSLDAMEKARFEEETAAWRAQVAALEMDLPRDPRAWIRRVLEQFLADTRNVDHAARVEGDGSWKMFVNTELEEKPQAWKACYRAGKAACTTARTEAITWLERLPR
jgi:hypothetical protein